MRCETKFNTRSRQWIDFPLRTLIVADDGSNCDVWLTLDDQRINLSEKQTAVLRRTPNAHSEGSWKEFLGEVTLKNE